MAESSVQPLHAPLRQAALELADLARVGDELEEIIARMAAAQERPDPELLVEAQAADLLSQRLTGVASFLQALADATPQDLMIDVRAALSGLTLSEQVRRLSGPTQGELTAEAGDLMLFDD